MNNPFKPGDKVRYIGYNTDLLNPHEVYTVAESSEYEDSVRIEGTYEDGTEVENGIDHYQFKLAYPQRDTPLAHAIVAQIQDEIARANLPVEPKCPTRFSNNTPSEKVKVFNQLVDNNPKTAVALTKARLSDVPPVALYALGAAMSDGANKYGRYNYRDTAVTASVFYDAMQRHLNDWYNGEDYADDSGIHHLAHLMAGAAIVLDAAVHNKLNDDRSKHKPESISRNPQYWKNV